MKAPTERFASLRDGNVSPSSRLSVAKKLSATSCGDEFAVPESFHEHLHRQDFGLVTDEWTRAAKNADRATRLSTGSARVRAGLIPAAFEGGMLVSRVRRDVNHCKKVASQVIATVAPA